MLWLPRKKGCLFAGDIREVTSDLGPRVYGEFQQDGCRSRDGLGGGLECREVAGGSSIHLLGQGWNFQRCRVGISQGDLGQSNHLGTF